MALSETEFNELVRRVKVELENGSQGVIDVPEAAGTDGISSLPAYQYVPGAAMPSVVKVPMAVLAEPARQAAAAANTAAENANNAAAAIASTIKSYIDRLVADAPTALDTLKELASALGNDPNFATTISTELAKKLNKSDVTDNLVSNDGTKVLSARQGKVLSERITDAQGVVDGITKYPNGIGVTNLSTGGASPSISVDVSGGSNGLNKTTNGVEVWAGGRKIGYWTAGGLRLTVPIHCSAGFFEDYT